MRGLLKVSLVLSVMGVFFLIFLSEFSSPLLIYSSDLGNFREGAFVEVEGVVESFVRLAPNFYRFSIRDSEGSIVVVCSDCAFPFLAGDSLRVSGVVKFYRDIIEVSAFEFILLDRMEES